MEKRYVSDVRQVAIDPFPSVGKRLLLKGYLKKYSAIGQKLNS